MRYSLAFALFACLCVAGGLTGYRIGFDRGYASGKAKRDSEQPYPKVYPVGEIVRATHEAPTQTNGALDYQLLIDSTQTMVFPDEWEALGGQCSMAPIPWLESLAVNATSGVHDRLSDFFQDLAGLKEAVATAEQDRKEMQQKQAEWIETMLEPVAKSLGKELTPIEGSSKLTGQWIVETSSTVDSSKRYLYEFVDGDTVSISLALYPEQSAETWYSIGQGTLVISGVAYIAATTPDDLMVLAPTSDTAAFLVATRSGETRDPPAND